MPLTVKQAAQIMNVSERSVYKSRRLVRMALRYPALLVVGSLFVSTSARADFPALPVGAVLPGCRAARSMEGTEDAAEVSRKLGSI